MLTPRKFLPRPVQLLLAIAFCQFLSRWRCMFAQDLQTSRYIYRSIRQVAAVAPVLPHDRALDQRWLRCFLVAGARLRTVLFVVFLGRFLIHKYVVAGNVSRVGNITVALLHRYCCQLTPIVFSPAGEIWQFAPV